MSSTQSKYAHTIYLNENSIFFNVLYPLPRPESIIIQLKCFCPVILFTCCFNDNKSLPLTQYQHAFVRNKYRFFPSKICHTKYNLLRSKLLQTEWNISDPFYLFKKKIDTSKIRRKVFNCFMYKIKNGEIYRRKKKWR